MKKALILGTNAGQADIIRYLKSTGWEVHSCGHKKEGPGVNLANYFHLTNTTNVETVEALAKKIDVDIVYSVSSDINIRTATKVSENLGLPVILNSDIIDLFHFKENLRKFLNQKNISTVAYKKLNSEEEIGDWNHFPCVVKPSDSQGQRGVQLIYEKKKINEAVKQAIGQSKSDTVIIEQYLTGIEVSTNMIIQNGKIIINEFTERLVFGEEYFGLPKGHSIPVRTISPEQLIEARKMTELLVKKLNLKNAVLYIQMKITDEGSKIVEIAPRLDGCHIWRLLSIARGYDLRKLAIEVLLNNKINENVNQETPNNYTLKFHHLKTGSIFSLANLNTPENTIYNEYRYTEGQTVQPINGNLEVVGYYIYKD